jgi:hypothetical protein
VLLSAISFQLATFVECLGIIRLMKFVAGMFFCVTMACAQTCAPRLPLGPADAVSGSLDETNCSLSDSTLYAEYSLTVPTRGQIQLDGASSAFDLNLILRDVTGHQLASGASISQPMERGQYSILVNAGTSGQSGAFTLRSNFTPQPATICRDFVSIGLNQSVSGRLSAASCLLPDNSAYDGYTLNSFGVGTLTITIESDGFTPNLIVRTDDGHALSEGLVEPGFRQELLVTGIDGNQIYTLIVSSVEGDTGAYKLSVSFTPADDQSCRPLEGFSVTGSAAGAISSDSCEFTPAGADANIFFNYYDLQVREPGLAEIRLSSGAFNPYLQLLDASGAVVAGDAYSGGFGTAIVRQQLRPGNYTIQVYSLDRAGDYTLAYTFTPQLPGTVVCPIYQVDAGAATQNTISDATCRTAEGPSQVYSIVMPQPGTIDIDMQSADFVPLLTLRDAKDNRIVNDDNFGNITDSHITADLPAGAYSVVAATGGLPGAYTFTYKIAPHDLAPCSQLQKLDVSSAFIGVLGDGSCRGPNGQPIDYYQVTTPADGALAAVMTSQAIDAFLTLQAADGTLLRWDDNSYGGSDAFLVQFLPAQTYRIAARASDAISGGVYRLDLRFSPGQPSGCAPVGRVGPGDSVQATLSFSSCQYPSDTFADIYQLDITDTAALDLRLESPDFDAYLQVLDSKGNVIDQDDNSGGGTNARITDTFDPGAYYVVARPFSSYSSTGQYTLTITPAQ